MHAGVAVVVAVAVGGSVDADAFAFGKEVVDISVLYLRVHHIERAASLPGSSSLAGWLAGSSN